MPHKSVDTWPQSPTGAPSSGRNHDVFRGDPSEPERQRVGLLRPFDDCHASMAAYIDLMRPRCVELARELNKTGSFYYHRDCYASHWARGSPRPRTIT